jgi:cyclopropane fatty-acyl-phospholipid synthase-like methyltransferase
MLAAMLEHDRFPRSSGYDAAWVLAEPFGANPLWLCEWLTEDLTIEPGMRVLDLGCGRAKSSVFIAKEFGARVWATDLWIEPGDNWRRIRDAGVADLVTPISAHARALPFAPEFFDAIIAVDSYQYFGNDDLYLNYISQFVVPSGPIGFASAGLMRAFESGVPDHLARLWGQDTWCVHTLDWWRQHWERTGLVDVSAADTMDDGWKTWLRWARANESSDWYVDMLERDAGEYLGYLRMVATRIPGVERWVPPSTASSW